MRDVDPHFDVYVGPIGCWMPWEPDAYKTGKVEHLEEELNKLMSEKQDNEAKAKEYFEQRVKETKRAAIEENKKKALESGNTLTQNIDENDNLYKVGSKPINDESTVAKTDIRKELFENEVIVPEHALSASLAASNDPVNVSATPRESTKADTTKDNSVSNNSIHYTNYIEDNIFLLIF